MCFKFVERTCAEMVRLIMKHIICVTRVFSLPSFRWVCTLPLGESFVLDFLEPSIPKKANLHSEKKTEPKKTCPKAGKSKLWLTNHIDLKLPAIGVLVVASKRFGVTFTPMFGETNSTWAYVSSGWFQAPGIQGGPLRSFSMELQPPYINGCISG